MDLKEFVKENIGEDVDKVYLKYHGKDLPFPLDFAIAQIKGRSRCVRKLAHFLEKEDFLFPDLVASEQASDERVAQYHAWLATDGFTKTIKVVDITAGLGIDALTMAGHGCDVTAIDIIDQKAQALRVNARVMGVEAHLTVECGDSIQILNQGDLKADLLFADPARRGDLNRRTYSFSETLPNVVTNLSLLLGVAPRILIKASPLLDITQVLSELPASSLHIVSVCGECKELLVEICRNTPFEKLDFVEIDTNGDWRILTFPASELGSERPVYAELQDITAGSFLYEPSAGLMKLSDAGAIISKFPGLRKIGRNTSLFVSDKFYPDFMGRISEIETVLDKKQMKSLKGERYNVSTRNYPIPADQLRKKLGVREGLDKFVYGFRAGGKETPMLVTALRR